MCPKVPISVNIIYLLRTHFPALEAREALEIVICDQLIMRLKHASHGISHDSRFARRSSILIRIYTNTQAKHIIIKTRLSPRKSGPSRFRLIFIKDPLSNSRGLLEIVICDQLCVWSTLVLVSRTIRALLTVTQAKHIKTRPYCKFAPSRFR